MRHSLVVLVLLAAACGSDYESSDGGGPSHTPDVCTTDDDCGGNDVCFHETGGSYCTETCTADADCGAKFDCLDEQEEPDGDCKDVGTGPDGAGFCELFDHVEACLD